MDTEKMFTRALSALRGPNKQGLGGRWVLVPPSAEYPYQFQPGQQAAGPRQSAADRRRRNLTLLAGFIVVTFVLGLFRPLRFLLFANVVADVAMIGYMIAIVWFAARPPARRPRTQMQRERPPEVAGGAN